jgi:hypothetical protein
MHRFSSYQESNNNHTGSSNEDDKSSTKSSSSHSSECSDNSVASNGGDVRREDVAKGGKSGSGVTPTETSNRWEQGNRHKIDETQKERNSKGKSDREKKDHNECRTGRERGHRDSRCAYSS